MGGLYVGRKLVEVSLSGGSDTSDLLGGFEQLEAQRSVQVSPLSSHSACSLIVHLTIQPTGFVQCVGYVPGLHAKIQYVSHGVCSYAVCQQALMESADVALRQGIARLVVAGNGASTAAKQVQLRLATAQKLLERWQSREGTDSTTAISGTDMSAGDHLTSCWCFGMTDESVMLVVMSRLPA